MPVSRRTDACVIMEAGYHSRRRAVKRENVISPSATIPRRSPACPPANTAKWLAVLEHLFYSDPHVLSRNVVSQKTAPLSSLPLFGDESGAFVFSRRGR